jgi:hypothetical protein
MLFFKVFFFFFGLSLVIGEVCCLCKFNVAIDAMEEESPKQFHTIIINFQAFVLFCFVSLNILVGQKFLALEFMAFHLLIQCTMASLQLPNGL